MDVEKHLPCDYSVRSGITNMSKELQKELNTNISNGLTSCGGVSCDGVKVESNGFKYYDFVVKYLNFGRKSVAQAGGGSWEILHKASNHCTTCGCRKCNMNPW